MRFFVLSSILGAGLMLGVLVASTTPLDKQASVLKDAKTLKVAYTLRLGGVRTDYQLTYSKPNLFMLESDGRLLESDGKTFWEYNKTAKTYTETPATPELLAKKAQSDEVLAWASFFTDDFMKNVSNAQAGGSRPIKGQPTTEVTFTYGATNPKSVTAYIDDKLSIARGFSFKGTSGDVLVTADKIETGDAMSADKFVFSAPADATKAVAPVASAGWTSVQPVFQANCTPCHNGRGSGGFSIDSYQSVMKGSRSGTVITPGDPANSRVLQLISGQATPKMPPAATVSQDGVDKLSAWIKAGAKE